MGLGNLIQQRGAQESKMARNVLPAITYPEPYKRSYHRDRRFLPLAKTYTTPGIDRRALLGEAIVSGVDAVMWY